MHADIFYLPMELVLAFSIAMLSISIAEFMRDIWHVICHQIPWLYSTFHRWHHIAYDSDFNIRSEALWRRSQWRHGLPEAFAMISGTGSLWYGLTVLSSSWYVFAAAWGFFYSLRELCFAILRGFGFHPKKDTLHVVEQLQTPPGQLEVNRAYHWNHHFAQPYAYFGGLYTPIDQILGTALSFQRKRIAIPCRNQTLESALEDRLVAAGALIQDITAETDLSTINILIVTKEDWCLMNRFLDTIKSNRDVAGKELWWMHTDPHNALPKRLEQSAMCTTRDIAVLSPDSSRYDEIAEQIVFQAKRHVRYILATHDPLTALLHRPYLSMNSLWSKHASRYNSAYTPETH